MDDAAERIRIHRLGCDDVAFMRQLLDVFADAFGDWDTYRQAPPDDTYLRQMLGRESIIVLAALADTTPAADLIAYELDKLEQARKKSTSTTWLSPWRIGAAVSRRR